MFQLRAAILAFLAVTLGAFRAVQRSENEDAATASTEISVTCTIQFVSLSPGDNEEDEECLGGDELVECVSDGDDDEHPYLLRDREFISFKDDDEVLVTMVPIQADSCVGSVYRATSVTLLKDLDDAQSLAEDESPSQSLGESSSARRRDRRRRSRRRDRRRRSRRRSSGSSRRVPYSFLIIHAEYTDGKPSCDYGCSASSLRSQLLTAVSQVRNDSFGQFPPKIEAKVITVKMNKKLGDLIHRRRRGPSWNSERKEVYKKAGSIADQYTYRAIYAPRINGEKLISGNAVAITGCSLARSSPTYGKCHSWFNPKAGGWQLMNHEFGHCFGLSHAASVLDGAKSGGGWKEYADKRTMMASSGKGDKPPSLGRHYVSAARDDCGWIPSQDLKKLKFNDTGYFKLGSLQTQTLHNRRRDSHRAIKIRCNKCRMAWAETESDNKNDWADGHLYIAYSEGIIAVHYFQRRVTSRSSGKSECWSRMERVKTFDNKYTNTSNKMQVRFCKTVSGNQAYVAISNRYSSKSSSQLCDEAERNPLD